ncbi:unnamed protein product [Closterium sp. Naga37s-1]|nr:unnamed protein product [Closterium sp. Naga37s-1]
MLHWTITSRDALKLAVEERSSTGAGGGGWLMLAWARKGQPFPSDAIFGNLFGRRTVAAFTISGPGAAGAQPASFTLGRTAFGTTFNGAIMKFSRQRSDGAVPVSYYGRNRLLWAFTTDSSANPTLPPFYRLMLHWKLLTTTSAAFCLQAKSGTAAAAGGWVSVAWSRGGAMVPADAVIGAPGGAAKTYAITSYSSVDPTSRFGITGGSVNSGFNGVLLK